MTIDELIIENEQEIKALESIIEKAKKSMESSENTYRFVVLYWMDIMLYQERLDTLTYQLRNLKAIKAEQQKNEA